MALRHLHERDREILAARELTGAGLAEFEDWEAGRE